MEKENREMYPTRPHLPAWRARLTAAALAGAIGCGPMHYVGVAGGPTLLNIRVGMGASAAPEPASAPAGGLSTVGL